MDLYDLLWLIAVVITGLAAGVMAGHLLLLGKFLSWFFESGNVDLFSTSYPVFLEAKKPDLLFDNVFSLCVVYGLLYFFILLFTGRLTILPLAAISLQLIFLLVFYLTGFAKLEHQLFKENNTSEEIIRKFRDMNIPVLTVLVIALSGSFILFICMKI